MTLSPIDDIVAGEHTVLTFTYTCGARPMEVGAEIGIAWRLPCDWGVPQWELPDAVNFVTVRSPTTVELRLGFEPSGGVKPWNHQFTAVLTAGQLRPGESIRFVFGDPAGGSPGWESQTSMAEGMRFIGMRRANRDGDWFRLRDLPPLRVRSGPPTSLALTCPSDCTVGAAFPLTVRLQDRWCNPSQGYAGTITIDGEDFEVLAMERLQRGQETFDVWKVMGRLGQVGRFRLRADAVTMGLSAYGNPVDCRLQGAELRLYWGDLHAGQSVIGCGQGSMDEFFWYAEHVASLQFASHQANDVYVTRGDWEETRAVTEAHNAEGSFITYLGCEWTTPPSAGGDRNVFYLEDQPQLGRAGRWFQEAQPDAWPDMPTPADLYEHLRDTDAIINLHAGGYTSNLRFSDGRTERLVEVHSTHGTSDWLVKDALQRGMKVGVSAGTDGIMGRPGACGPGRRQTRNVTNGCLGVYAEAHTRLGIWEGIQERRCIATTGERIRLTVRSGERWSGEEFRSDKPIKLDIEAAGTAPIERIIIRRGALVVATEELWRPDPKHPRRFRVVWAGTRQPGTSRDQAMDWAGDLSADGGALVLTGAIGQASVLDGVVQDEATVIRWRSLTAGNVTGFEFETDAPHGSVLRFNSTPIRFEVPLTPSMSVYQELAADDGMGYVRIGRAPDRSGPCDARLTFTDQDTPPGEHAYWVEVVQINGGRAWSSPVFHTRS